VVSSAPGRVGVATPSVTIPAGSQAANATLDGVLPGPATITVSNPAYLDGITAATTTASLNIVSGSATLNASFGTTITINFESNGTPAAAPTPGISVSLTPTDPNCLAATSPSIIATGLVNTTSSLTYGGSATLPCTTKLLAQAANLQPDSINVAVNPVPGITVNAATVGSGLQVGAFGNLGASNHGGTTVTLTSGNSNLLLSTSASLPGSSSITVFVPNNSTGFNYTVQALEGLTGTTPVTVTATAPGFASGSGTISLVQGAIDLIGPPTSTTTLSPTNNIYARSGIPNSQATPGFLTQLQVVRAGAPSALTVTFNSQTAAVGDLVKAGPSAGATQTAVIPVLGSNTPTDTTSGGVLFRPLLSGSTVISASLSGFLSVTSAAGSTVTVTQPGITVNAATVGSGLQVGAFGNLGASNHGGTTVTLTSSNAAVLLSPNTTTAGSSSITVFVPNNSTGFSYTVQGLEGRTDTVTAAITATASGFTDGIGTVQAVPPAFDVIGLPPTPTAGGPDVTFYVRVGIANSTGAFLTQLQAVRAGAPASLTVTITSNGPSIGTLVVTAGPNATQQVQILATQTNSPTSVSAGGVAFRPLASGTVIVTTTIPGFIATPTAVTTVNVQ
ncbi:MAG: beta strand repeat-containing protein, partial [Candidatus Binatia bacterium]